jgi:hypothetical protein
MAHLPRIGLYPIQRTIKHLHSANPSAIPSAQHAIKAPGGRKSELKITRAKVLDPLPDFKSFDLPLSEKKVFIPSMRLQGTWKDRISRLPLSPSEKNISLLFWGRHGKPVLDELEQKLKFKFNEEVSTFVVEVGNLGWEGCKMTVAGSEDGTQNCVTSTEEIGLLKKDQPAEGVKIMDFAGLSYILQKDGTIKAYEHTYIKPDGIVFSYDSLYDLIHKSIQQLCDSE